MPDQERKSKDDGERKTLELMNRTWADYGRGLDIPIGDKSLYEIRKRNARRYLGDHHDKEPRQGMLQATVNRIGNAITTTVAVQTEQPWQLRLTPRETDDPPKYFLTDAGIRKIQTAVAEGKVSLEGFLIDNVTSDDEIDAAHGQALEAMTKPQPMPDGSVSPAILEGEKDLVKITDAKCAEELQVICVAMFDRAQVDYYTTMSELMANVTGDQMVIYEWDNQRQRPKLTTPNWTTYRFDPRGMWIDECRGVMFEEEMLARDAIEEWPQFKEDIISGLQGGHGATLGSLSTDGRKEGGSPSFIAGSTQSGTDYPVSDEATVTIRTMWRRGHQFPIAEDDERIAEGMEHLGAESGKTNDDLESSRKADPPQFTEGIRLVVHLVEADRVVMDGPCPYSEIPAPWVKNLVIPNSPYGMGEPQRQEDIQLLINRVMGMILNTLRYHAYPMEVMPRSLKPSFTQDGADWRAHPGRVTWMEDDDWKEYVLQGSLRGFTIDPPPIPDSWIRLLQLLLNESQVIGNDVDAVQGQAPTPDISGVALDALQSAGTRVMTLKAKHLEWTFEWISRLLVESVINWLEDSEWDKYSAKYGGQIRAALRERAKVLTYDVRVESVAGRGATKRLDAAKAQNAFNSGAISQQTYLEMLDIPDARGEIMRQNEEQAAKQAALAGIMPQEQQGGAGGNGSSPNLTPPARGPIPSAPQPGNGQGRF